RSPACRLYQCDRPRIARAQVVERVTELDGERTRRAHEKISARAGEDEMVCRTGDDVEGGRVGGERAGARGDRNRAGECAADVLAGDAAGGGRRPQSGDGARAARL